MNMYLIIIISRTVKKSRRFQRDQKVRGDFLGEEVPLQLRQRMRKGLEMGNAFLIAKS